MLLIVKVDSIKMFGNLNDGYRYGLEYYDKEDHPFPIECEWFKTREEREITITECLQENPDIKIQ